MRFNYFLFILIISIFFCCSENYDSNNDTSIITQDFKKLDTIIPLSGYWISEKYYNNIQTFKSPLKAQDGALFLVIPKKTLQQTILISNFHEGGPLLKILKHKNIFEIWETESDTLIQCIHKIKLVSSQKIKIGNDYFLKINPNIKNSNYQILENILFEGFYTDSQNKLIEFKKNGQIKGLENIKYYYPQIDYFDVGMQVDQIGLGKSENNIEQFGFKFENDTLKLYKLDCKTFEENRCVEVTYGKLAYKLWKKTTY